MRQQLEKTTALACEHLSKSQVKQKRWYDNASGCTFEQGEEVLLLLLTSEGPLQVRRRVGPVMYEVYMPARKQSLQTFHVNMLQKMACTTRTHSISGGHSTSCHSHPVSPHLSGPGRGGCGGTVLPGHPASEGVGAFFCRKEAAASGKLTRPAFCG